MYADRYGKDAGLDARLLSGCRFSKPSHMDDKAVVGLQAGPLTRIAEGDNFLADYHESHCQVIG